MDGKQGHCEEDQHHNDGTNSDALHCNDLDIEVIQFLIDSFICLFPAQQCCEYGQDCCIGADPASDQDVMSDNKHITFDGQVDEEDEDNDGILEQGNDRYRCNFCHAIES